jgi:hypothetical protein
VAQFNIDGFEPNDSCIFKTFIFLAVEILKISKKGVTFDLSKNFGRSYRPWQVFITVNGW